MNKDLSQKDVLELCQPSQDTAMRAYTITKLLTTRNIMTNVPHVLEPMNYQTAIEEANQFLVNGDKKKALDAFKLAVAGEKIKLEDLANAARQEIKAELELA